MRHDFDTHPDRDPGRGHRQRLARGRPDAAWLYRGLGRRHRRSPLAPPAQSRGRRAAGDSVHCFGDGVLIASAFVADLRLGVVAALAVLAHEVPHHIGDLAVLRITSANRRVALIKVSLAGAVTALGGLVGWWLVDRLRG